MQDFGAFFEARPQTQRLEGRYRLFADLERRAGAFPRAFHHQLLAVAVNSLPVVKDWLLRSWRSESIACLAAVFARPVDLGSTLLCRRQISPSAMVK